VKVLASGNATERRFRSLCVSLFGISELCFTSQKNVKYIVLINVYSGFQEWNSRTRFFQYAIAS
jgi:hypothetical protein